MFYKSGSLCNTLCCSKLTLEDRKTHLLLPGNDRCYVFLWRKGEHKITSNSCLHFSQIFNIRALATRHTLKQYCISCPTPPSKSGSMVISSRLSLVIDFRGLCWKSLRTCSVVLVEGGGRPVHKHLSNLNVVCHSWMMPALKFPASKMCPQYIVKLEDPKCLFLTSLRQ